jgi:hypothetical protein
VAGNGGIHFAGKGGALRADFAMISENRLIVPCIASI